MRPKILLINPPIYDFTAYDFWLKPYGMLRVAGQLRNQAEFYFFDFLDRSHSFMQDNPALKKDSTGRGEYCSMKAEKPHVFSRIPRHYKRFGLPRTLFQRFLAEESPFDFALIQTVMTYWYPGVREVIQDIRAYSPQTKIVLGGAYTTLCPEHARGLGADLVVEGVNLQPLWKFFHLSPESDALPLWKVYERLDTGVLKLTEGCPFKCTYCSVPHVYPKFLGRPVEQVLRESHHLIQLGVKNIAFYDDALLFHPQKILIPFLHHVIKQNLTVHFHTPNALNARFITPELADLMMRAGFQKLYLGFESSAYEWQKKTGGKVYSDEFARAVENLCKAGAKLDDLTAYIIVGHPEDDLQNVEASMSFVQSLGVRTQLSEFSPIPATPDGEKCRRWVKLDEPLWHNKTAFSTIRLGFDRLNQLKNMCWQLNRSLVGAIAAA